MTTPPSTSIGLHWWNPQRSARAAGQAVRRLGRRAGPLLRSGNFGDELSPALFRQLFDIEPRWQPARRARVFHVGSIVELALASDRALVLGSGLRTGLAAPIRSIDAPWVRGALTRDRLALPASTLLGDPAIMAARLWPIERSITGAKLFIPHFRDLANRENDEVFARLDAAGFSVLAPTTGIEDVIAAIATAACVATSGLHGVILADAYSRPTIPVRFARVSGEPDFKFLDYGSTVGGEFDTVTVDELLDPQAAPRIEDFVGRRQQRVRPHIDERCEQISDHLPGLRLRVHEFGHATSASSNWFGHGRGASTA